MGHTRSSGILLHVTSLPGPYGIGDLGPAAYRFADWLEMAGQRIWQVLPLVPVGAGYSPYSSPSTFAGNPLLISPERLQADGLLSPDDLEEPPVSSSGKVHFNHILPFKRRLLERAFERFKSGRAPALKAPFAQFCDEQTAWLDDYALFMAVREAQPGQMWTDWPDALAQRRPEALEAARERHHRAIEQHTFWQFLFFRQWRALKIYCNDRGIRIFGDVPIYVAHNSADVWAHRELFYLEEDGRPTCVSGVPPDYFSETGQRWGNPLYRWNDMKSRDYAWWQRRIQAALDLFDLVRLDHFRGFEAYWEIPAEEETAVEGSWVDGPGAHFFEVLEQHLGRLPLIAEDLGEITPAVRELMAQFELPGMAVLQFGLQAGATSNFLPHNFERNLVAYTGTHDNDTLVGWWRSQQELPETKDARPFTRRYVGLDRSRGSSGIPAEQGRDGSDAGDQIHWPIIRTLMQSVAHTVILPMQDVLGLGSEARMNVPGEPENNWTWRCRPEQLSGAHAQRLREMAQTYGR